MDVKLCIVVTTTSDYDAARALARTLLTSRLAACVQMSPIQSCYIWKDELREDEEFLVQIKARMEDYDALAAAIRAAHSYETPEILRLDVDAGDRSYLEWAAFCTRRC
jgi:periplasmic divalent cation tolerance protein